MNKYVVTYVRESYYTVVIEAEDIAQANKKAKDVSISDLEHDYDSGVYKLYGVKNDIRNTAVNSL